MRKNLNFGNMPSSPITDVGLGKFCAGACLTEESKKTLADHRCTDDFGISIHSILKSRQDGKKRFVVIRDDIINACKVFVFQLSLYCPHGT